MQMINAAWDEVPPETISHCFAHTGIFPEHTEAVLRNIDLDDAIEFQFDQMTDNAGN
ncbi:hypothetical protein HK096_006561, partial [Nowakowskiella sp. JEL0078]